MSIQIRKARTEDLEELLTLYDAAKAFMEQHGNPHQWTGDDAVTREGLEALIVKDVLFVGEEQGNIRFSFAYILGEDPTYGIIDDGAWLNEEFYGTVHRVASDGSSKGVVKVITQWALEQNPNLRIDTHHDNYVMQKALAKEGFTRCGIIHLANGDPR
ncbi:MAG: GNAT family N-acetyltransferase, partial [Oscillospiraceae bacterium]|nr:GNAT family N-acetyltransferase [Oscillospiraceae bacterium]